MRCATYSTNTVLIRRWFLKVADKEGYLGQCEVQLKDWDEVVPQIETVSLSFISVFYFLLQESFSEKRNMKYGRAATAALGGK